MHWPQLDTSTGRQQHSRATVAHHSSHLKAACIHVYALPSHLCRGMPVSSQRRRQPRPASEIRHALIPPLLHRQTLPPGMGEPPLASRARYASRVQTIFDSGPVVATDKKPPEYLSDGFNGNTRAVCIKSNRARSMTHHSLSMRSGNSFDLH